MADLIKNTELEIMKKDVRLDELKMNIKKFNIKKIELTNELQNVGASIEQTNKNIKVIEEEIEKLKK